MNLDRILYKLKISRKSDTRAAIKGDLIKKRFHHKNNSDKLFVMLPGWGAPLRYNLVLRKVVSRNNYSFLEYEFPKEILSSHWEKTLEYFDIIRNEVTKDIRELKKEHKINAVYLAGVSLGSFHACRIANHNQDINELCLIMTGHSLAETIWDGILTQHIKKDLEVQGITLNLLKKYWQELEPENNINDLKVQHITVVISKADQVVPFYSGNKLLENLKEYKYNVSYDINNSLGHLLTGTKFYYNSEKVLFKK